MSSEKFPNPKSVYYPEKKDFVEKTYNALLDVRHPEIPIQITKIASSLDLKEKPEFHISVIASKVGEELLTKTPHLKDEIKKLFEHYGWQYTSSGEYFLMEKKYEGKDLDDGIPPHIRQTIIERVELRDLKDFYNQLRELSGLNFDTPFPHITFFSGSDYKPKKSRGIGIYSEEDFEIYKKQALH